MQHKAQRRNVVHNEDEVENDDEPVQPSADELKRMLAGAPALPDSIALTHLLDPTPYELLRAEIKAQTETLTAALARNDTQQMRKELTGFESRAMKQFEDLKRYALPARAPAPRLPARACYTPSLRSH